MNVNKLLLKCNTWQDFKSQLYTLSDKQKGDCFEELTKYFLRIHPTYRTQLRDVWTLKNVPPSVRKRLNLPGLDEGIDLIAETKDRTFWAIQCKYRDDESKSLTRKDLSTFTDLAFGISKNIELALVCTTADRFSHKLTLYGDRISFCSSEMWQSLDRDFFRQLHALIGRKAAIIKPVSPREHQKRAITNAYEHYVTKGNSRGKLIMPCGTGKSLTGYWLAERHADIKDGPIIDIGNKSDLSRNRILVVVENQNQLKLTLLDSSGKKYELQGKFQNASGGGKIECLWSSRYGIIALTYNDEILAQTTLSDLSIFIDSHEQRAIQVAGSLDGRSAFANYKELKIYVLKEMGK